MQSKSSILPVKSSALPTRPDRERGWKPLLLGVLVLSNLVYVAVGIVLVTQSPEKLHLRENIILDDFMFSRTQADNAASVSKAATNASQVVADLPSNMTSIRRLKCVGWRATGRCSPDGVRQPEKDQGCGVKIQDGTSGYCEVEDMDNHEVFRIMKRSCTKGKPGANFRCTDAPGFANFRAEMQHVINEAPASVANTNDSDKSRPHGIVMVVYPALIASAYATIRSLRHVLGCQLPVEIWFRPDEIRGVPRALEPLESLAQNDTRGGISFREISHPRAVRYAAKIYAIRYSRFDQVLFLDADNAPVRDPAYLFKTPEFAKTGALFWPDYWHPQHSIFFINEKSLLWQLLDMPFVDMFEQESGQLLIDRRKHAAPLELVVFFSNHRPDYFSRLGLAWGDKDLFRFAWLKLGASFHMIESPPSVAGKLYGKSFCGMTMVQHDPKGGIIFLHRNQLKLTGKPGNESPKMIPQNGTDAEDFPDPAMWTHLVSFRSSSSRSKYIIQAHWETKFSDSRRCFGRSDLDGNPNFYAEQVVDLSFSSLETHLRQFAMEAAQLDKRRAGKD